MSALPDTIPSGVRTDIGRRSEPRMIPLEALQRQREQGVPRRLVGFDVTGRGIAGSRIAAKVLLEQIESAAVEEQ